MPAEALRERLQEQTEGIRHDGREADHEAEEPGENDLPAGVGNPGFFQLCFDGLKDCLLHQRTRASVGDLRSVSDVLDAGRKRKTQRCNVAIAASVTPV
jgi:hypothetical protein